MVIAIFVNRAYYHAVCLGLQFSHSDHQKNCIFKLWVFFWGSPYFLLLSLRNKKYPFFLTFSTKLGGTLRAIKKMTQNYNGPGPGRYYRETAVFTFSRKVFFWLKMHFNPKFLKRLKRQLFSVDNFFPVVAGTWLGERRVCFFWARNLSFWPKNPIFTTRPQFWSTDCL